MNSNHLAIFEPNAGGHHGLFVQHLIRYWGDQQLEGVLELIVTEQFLAIHEQISELRERYSDSDIRLSIIDPLPAIKNGSLQALLMHDLRQGAVLKNKLSQIRPSHALLMYFDHMQISLGTTLRLIPQTHIAGIYFRPSFHYPIHASSSAQPSNSLQQRRKKLQLRLALNNPNLKTLFSLDPYVVPTLNTMSRHTQAVVLPDGIENVAPGAEVQSWDLQDNRFIAFCFGSLARRKGVFTLLEALPYLPKAIQKQLALVFVGVVSEEERDAFYAKTHHMRNETEVQIVVDDRFVDDAEVQPMIQRADLILVAYQHHIGSSNVLIRAADAGIPVLGSNYGLIGAQIHDNGLGTAVDTTNPRAVADGLKAHMTQSLKSFDAVRAQEFAATHDSTLYAETILSTLGFK